MKRGPKKLAPEVKIAQGTYQACRDKPVHLITNTSVPVAPDYLTPEAKVIWAEEIDRVTSAGTCELDSSLFARYCSLESLVRAEFAQGIVPRAAYLSELRKAGEILGIAGVSSRALRGKPIETKSGNPFAAMKRP
ncbi:hypothetical protein [Erythrobacter sp. R86502]|uniref:hypothetical protein n=1 Tax=Erythrobacter sp. R86502 TaxID=3093846 RepID=UPI0036D3FA99